jgi:hypothetical protein
MSQPDWVRYAATAFGLPRADPAADPDAAEDNWPEDEAAAGDEFVPVWLRVALTGLHIAGSLALIVWWLW